MGGLLDKANAAKEPETEAAELVKATKAATNPSSAPAASTPAAGSPDTATKVNLAGWVIILIGAILSLQGGAWGLAVVAIVLVAGIGAIVQAERMRGSINQVKLGASIVVALLIATTPYAAVMLVPTNASMAISEVELNEDTNELSFKVRGTMSSVDVSIEADGVEMWTDSGDVSNDMKKFKVPLAEFFAGNGEDYAGNEVVEYVIKGVGSNGQEGEIKIPTRFTTREAQNAGVRIAELHDSNDAEEYVGITMEVLVGLLGPNEDAQNGGGFSAVGLRPMNADYQIQFTVSGGTTWSESLISVDGDMATWSPASGGTGSASTAGWFGLTGSGTDNSGVYYLDKSEFYEEAGCYTFTVDITNTLGDQTVFTAEYSWNIDLTSGERDSNNDPVRPKGDGVTTTC
ncbi:MAG: hypothetical protein VYA29_02655 [Candidatus Thermoplasmatota archaeon]|nr:hypothetical protein [Candidatus Thermoplasmatota archaeon]